MRGHISATLLVAMCWVGTLASPPSKPHFAFRCNTPATECKHGGTCRQYGQHYQACDCWAGWSGPTCLYSTDCKDADGFCGRFTVLLININYCDQWTGNCVCALRGGQGPHCSAKITAAGEAYDATADRAVACNTGRAMRCHPTRSFKALLYEHSRASN